MKNGSAIYSDRYLQLIANRHRQYPRFTSAEYERRRKARVLRRAERKRRESHAWTLTMRQYYLGSFAMLLVMVGVRFAYDYFLVTGGR